MDPKASVLPATPQRPSMCLPKMCFMISNELYEVAFSLDDGTSAATKMRASHFILDLAPRNYALRRAACSQSVPWMLPQV